METAKAMMVDKLLKDPDCRNTRWILMNRYPAEYNNRLHVQSDLSGPNGAPVAIDMPAKFTVIVNSPEEQSDEYPVVDSETGLPVADHLNPYKTRAAAGKNGAS